MELRDAIPMMNSENFKEHFIAEYQQVKIRYGMLYSLLENKGRN